MAIRQIRMRDDEILKKHCKEVKKFDERLGILLDDNSRALRKLKELDSRLHRSAF